MIFAGSVAIFLVCLLAFLERCGRKAKLETVRPAIIPVTPAQSEALQKAHDVMFTWLGEHEASASLVKAEHEASQELLPRETVRINNPPGLHMTYDEIVDALKHDIQLQAQIDDLKAEVEKLKRKRKPAPKTTAKRK